MITKEVLVRMCRNWNSQTLLVGTSSSAATMANRLRVSQNVKQNHHRAQLSPPRYMPTELKAGIQSDASTSRFTTAKKWRRQQINKSSVYVQEILFDCKRNEILICAIIWIKFENIC